LVVQDREREIEDDDTGGPGREQSTVGRVELARAQHSGGKQDDRASAEEHTQGDRAQPG
jgi:hypothetical protein